MHYTLEELRALGITCGRGTLIDKSVRFFNSKNIILGQDVRIDCFCVISAGADGVHIGRNVHLGAGSYIFGGGGRVDLCDFAGFSSRVTVYSSSDDYSEGYLTNPTVPEKFRKTTNGPVHIGKHVIVGCGSIIMPNLTLGAGASIGALSFVRRNIPELAIVSGNPLRLIGQRNPKFLELEKELLKDEPLG